MFKVDDILKILLVPSFLKRNRAKFLELFCSEFHIFLWSVAVVVFAVLLFRCTTAVTYDLTKMIFSRLLLFFIQSSNVLKSFVSIYLF